MKRNTLLALFFVLFSCLNSLAQPSTPQILSSDMVLQQGQEVPIWGTAKPGERITVRFEKQRRNTRADKDGHWMVRLSPLKANKIPKDLHINGSKTAIVYKNIVVGEVWLCSGQSNMEYTMQRNPLFAPPAKGNDLTAIELQKPANPMIRVFHSKRDNTPSSWKVADRESLAKTSAAGYFFAKALQEKLDVPVGIITAALGGSRIEAWTAGKAYAEAPLFADEFAKTGKVWKLEPGTLYDKMIAPLAPFALKGFLWYQGENSCGVRDRQYAEKYEVMVHDWRNAFQNPSAPFYSVLLGAYVFSNKLHRGGPALTAEELPIFRAQQIASTKRVTHSDFTVVTDLTDDVRDIHPSYKWEVGARLARLALAKDYGFSDIVWSGPRVQAQTTVADSILLTFDHAGSGLKTNDGRRLNWFEIAGEDGVFRPALADFKAHNQVVVHHHEIASPKYVRFGWHETAIPNFVNSEGLPAAPFWGTSIQ